jgi:HK97 family phage major capsid protein
MTVDQIQLVAKKFGVLTYYSRDLDEDAALSVGNLIMEEAALAFANKEDECGFNGTGASTYNGIVGIKESLAAGSKYTAITGNTSFGTLDLEDFQGMIAKLPSYAFRDGGPSWYIHRSGWALSMLRLATAAGGNTTRELAAGASEVQFMGYPVVFVEVMNNTTTTQTSTDGLVYFGNIRQGVDFGDRRGVTMDMSREVAFTTQQIAVLGTERFDIKVHDAGNANNAGAIVMLSTPGS